MSAEAVLQRAFEVGIHIEIDGTDLVLAAWSEPPKAIVNELFANKPAIVALLQPRKPDWTAADWRAFYAERAGVAEHAGGRSRSQAEAMAYEACISEWMTKNHPATSPDRCAWCLEPVDEGSVVVPYGTAKAGHAWLHPQCWRDWYRAQQDAAIAALKELGISQHA